MSGQIILIVGPSGVGKSTLIKKLIKELPQDIHDLVTCTTRKKREGESERNPYFFFTEKEFKEKLKQNAFIEWAVVHGYLYGVLHSELERTLNLYKFVIVDVDVQGAQTLMKKYEPISVFIHPPDMQSLSDRLQGRNDMGNEERLMRLNNAKKEMDLASLCKHQIVNESLAQSFEDLKKILANYIDSV